MKSLSSSPVSVSFSASSSWLLHPRCCLHWLACRPCLLSQSTRHQLLLGCPTCPKVVGSWQPRRRRARCGSSGPQVVVDVPSGQLVEEAHVQRSKDELRHQSATPAPASGWTCGSNRRWRFPSELSHRSTGTCRWRAGQQRPSRAGTSASAKSAQRCSHPRWARRRCWPSRRSCELLQKGIGKVAHPTSPWAGLTPSPKRTVVAANHVVQMESRPKLELAACDRLKLHRRALPAVARSSHWHHGVLSTTASSCP